MKEVFFTPIGKLRYFVFYVHADAEGINYNQLDILEKIIIKLKKNNYKFLTMKEIFHLYVKDHKLNQKSS